MLMDHGYDAIERFILSANGTAMPSSWSHKNDRLLAAVGSLESAQLKEHDPNCAHEHGELAWRLWQQRAQVAREFRQYDEELCVLQGSSAGSTATGLSAADVSKHPAFDYCHVVLDDADVQQPSKRARHDVEANETFGDGDGAVKPDKHRVLAPMKHNNAPGGSSLPRSASALVACHDGLRHLCRSDAGAAPRPAQNEAPHAMASSSAPRHGTSLLGGRGLGSRPGHMRTEQSRPPVSRQQNAQSAVYHDEGGQCDDPSPPRCSLNGVVAPERSLIACALALAGVRSHRLGDSTTLTWRRKPVGAVGVRPSRRATSAGVRLRFVRVRERVPLKI